ncbi:type II toxin-antitoxin system VapC family toxin [Tellurirhabdus rosea]|uniref:type II toxin-antitoxin system VapC family toxin n=1 Tax=Tellurirhabdus rosea TaxID=2674997 RepID=UPI0022525EEC|nr:type II toxin-antitoxin system VapC family toxin [Tellurirhabdus rosea]
MPAYLIDTQVLLWFQKDPTLLPERVRLIIEDGTNEIWVSQVSFFEIAIKMKVGSKPPEFKLSIEELIQQTVRDEFGILSISNDHISTYSSVPLFPNHRNPAVA